MPIRVRIEAGTSQMVLNRLGDETVSPGLREELSNAAENQYLTLALLDQQILDWSESTLRPYPQDWIPYDQWFNRQSSLDFWRIAFSWSVFWQAVYLGPGQLVNWPHIVENALPSEPTLGFLDVSNGYVQWDFQIEMLYRLCDPDVPAAQQFRKGWNRRSPETIALARKLTLPDGRVLSEILNYRVRAGGWKGVTAPPVRATALLLPFASP